MKHKHHLNSHGRDHASSGQKNRRKTEFPFAAGAVMTAVAVIINIVFAVELFYLTKFSALGTNIFVLINYAGLVLLLLIDFLVFLSIRSRRKVLIGISIVFLLIASVLGGAAGIALSKINQTVDKITSTEYTVSVSTSLVIYDNAGGDPIVDKTDLTGKKVGVADGTDTETLARDYLDESGITPEYTEYSDYFTLFKALISEEIDCAVLPGTYVTLIGSDDQLATYVEDTTAIDTFTKDVTATSNAGSAKDLTKDPFTVLITGENEGLADTIILVSVNPISMDVTMTSIARDSYVPITCYGGSRSKINAAHAVSESCIVDTVTQLTGIKIDYTVEFNFASVIEVVDAVGGVDVYNDTPFYGQSWNLETDSLEVIPIPHSDDGSIVHMNGQQALGFVRERHAFVDGDFARQRHQQAVISDLISKVMASKDPNTYLKILEAAGNNIKTNLTAEQMVQFISYAMKKAERYYDSSNLAGVFNISSGRITGYNVMMWDDSLDMYLYTYWLYDGALQDAWNVVENNIDMTRTPTVPSSVSWSSAEAYTKPVQIQEYYNESTETTIGGPSESNNSYGSSSNSYSSSSSSSGSSAASSESTTSSSQSNSTLTPEPAAPEETYDEPVQSEDTSGTGMETGTETGSDGSMDYISPDGAE